jgi:hypothetical protein
MPVKEPETENPVPISFQIEALFKDIHTNKHLFKTSPDYRKTCLRNLKELSIKKAKYNQGLALKLTRDNYTLKEMVELFDGTKDEKQIDTFLRLVDLRISPTSYKILSPQTEVY